MCSKGDILPALEGTLIHSTFYLARKVKHSTITLLLAASTKCLYYIYFLKMPFWLYYFRC